MDISIKSPSSRIMLERTDNGVIMYSISSENVVNAKQVYEIYNREGTIDFHSMGSALTDIIENLNFPFEDQSSNRQIGIYVEFIDANKEPPEKEE